jgi:hypothetical protein
MTMIVALHQKPAREEWLNHCVHYSLILPKVNGSVLLFFVVHLPSSSGEKALFASVNTAMPSTSETVTSYKLRTEVFFLQTHTTIKQCQG